VNAASCMLLLPLLLLEHILRRTYYVYVGPLGRFAHVARLRQRREE
jgi:hypothetical protein